MSNGLVSLPSTNNQFCFFLRGRSPKDFFFRGGDFFLLFCGKKSELGVNPILGLGVEEKR